MNNYPSRPQQATASLSPAQKSEMIKAYAAKMEMPEEGITILGGKPYPNSAGLLVKARNIGLKSIEVDLIRESCISDKVSAKAKAKVTLNDGSSFEEMGLASKESVQMSTLHTDDNLSHMAVTRAKNRALRSSIGLGYVSAEEVKDAHDRYADTTNLDSAPVMDAAGEIFETPNDDLGDHLRHKVENEEADLAGGEKPKEEEMIPGPNLPEEPSDYERLQNVIKLRKLIKETNKEEAKILAFFKKEKLEDLTTEEYKMAKDSLETTLAQMVMGMIPPAKEPAMANAGKSSGNFYNDMPPVSSPKK